VVHWRRERKRDGWYPEDVDWLVGEVETLRGIRLHAQRYALRCLEAEATAERLRGTLARLEWAVSDRLQGGMACPACDGIQPDHEPGCELAAALAGNDETTRPGPREG
jgi:hypothetical protein